MPSLGFAPSFFSRYPDLPKDVQKKIPALMAKFSDSTLAGIHLEKPHSAADPRARTIRVDKFWRGVVMAPAAGDRYALFDVLPHDKAYDWCARNSFVTNAATNVVEVVDVVAAQTVVETLAAATGRAAGATAAGAIPGGLFDRYADDVLVGLGVATDQLPMVRLIRSEADLAAIVGILPPSQGYALSMLRAGYSVREAREELGIAAASAAPTRAGVDDAALLASPSVFFPRDAAELAEALQRPMELWRIFLHPSQRRIAYRETYNGPVRVTGGAGTGKTVVAIHRTHFLAGRLPKDSAQRILLTTFVRTLADNMAANLESLSGPAGTERVDVSTVDAFARRVVQRAEGADPPIVSDNGEINKLWEAAVSKMPGAPPVPALRQEWEQVILAQGLHTQAEYLAAARPGRGVRLSRARRLVVWAAVERFTEELSASGGRTFYQLANDAAGYLAGGPSSELYAHVIVDEAQDLHPAQWRLLHAAVRDGANDLFVVGDAHQRIYDHRISLSSMGIDIRGRSYRLTLNYRTTEEILRWCVGLLRGARFDDLDAGTDSMAGYRSAFRGTTPPILAGYATSAEEMADLVRVVRGWIDAGLDPATIGVAARFRRTALVALSALRDAGIPVRDLVRARGGGVEVATMHRMKGLEYRAVAVVDVSAASVPAKWSVTPEADDPKAHEQDLLRERCLLYVACTRAREFLHVSWSGRPSPFIAAAWVAARRPGWPGWRQDVHPGGPRPG